MIMPSRTTILSFSFLITSCINPSTSFTQPLKTRLPIIKHRSNNNYCSLSSGSSYHHGAHSANFEKRVKSHVITSMSSKSDGISSNSDNSSNTDNENSILGAAIAVGSISAITGFLYGKALEVSVHNLWTFMPNLLLQKGIALNPLWFITSTCTLGGLLVGIISSKFKTTFAVADFVSAFSSAPDEAKKLPKSRSNLLPLLLLSLLTSVFGFSLGPEAPMVCAGSLIGASMARKWYGEGDLKKAEILAYAGAAGALTSFMGIPIAGSIFALEMTRPSVGMSTAARDSLSPAIMASLSALYLTKAILLPSTNEIGGHFVYGATGHLGGRTMVLTSILAGVLGATVGTIFHKFVSFFKHKIWPDTEKEYSWRRIILVKTIIGLIVGMLSCYFPQTLFWGEGSLQSFIDGQKTAFSATKHGLSSMLTSLAVVDPSLPFSSPGSAAKVGLVKILSIALACIGKFPGGIIFPLFSAAAPLAYIFTPFIGPSVMPVFVMSLMASLQGSVTRTPLASVLILGLTASSITELSVILPGCLAASYISVYVARLLSKNSYFKYGKN